MPNDLKAFWYLRHDLYTVEGVPMYAGRIYIPQALRKEVLEALHSAHQGEASMKTAARSRFFWPGMDAAIRQVRLQCRACNGMAPSQPREEMPEPPTPTFPFEDVATDFYTLEGSNYAIYADRYSGWLGIHKPNSSKFSDLATYMRQNFQTFGVPEVIETDGGPPFNGKEWKDFLAKWGIRHRMSSANYHQSNSRAELAVKTAKRLLRDNLGPNGTLDTDEVSRALLQYLNTPLRGLQESPAQIIYGRPVRDTMPQGPGHEGWHYLNTHRELGQAQLKAQLKERYDAHTKNLPPLRNGDVVVVQIMEGPKPLRWDRTARVVECLGNRQYSIVMDGSKRILLRNRRFLRQIVPLAHAPQPRVTTAVQLPDATQPPVAPHPRPVLVESTPARPSAHQPLHNATQPEGNQAEPAQQHDDHTPLRRSTRARKPPAYLNDYATEGQL